MKVVVDQSGYLKVARRQPLGNTFLPVGGSAAPSTLLAISKNRGTDLLRLNQLLK